MSRNEYSASDAIIDAIDAAWHAQHDTPKPRPSRTTSMYSQTFAPYYPEQVGVSAAFDENYW